MSEDEHDLSIDSTGEGKDQYFVDGKRVDKETWRRHLHESQNKLTAELASREGTRQADSISRDLQSVRNELVHNVFSSGVSAALESGSVPPLWFRKWAQTDTLPDAFAQGQLKAIDIMKKRENTWPEIVKRNAWVIALMVIAAIVGVIVSHAWP